jgi:hypothetical protein
MLLAALGSPTLLDILYNSGTTKLLAPTLVKRVSTCLADCPKIALNLNFPTSFSATPNISEVSLTFLFVPSVKALGISAAPIWHFSFRCRSSGSIVRNSSCSIRKRKPVICFVIKLYVSN